MKYLDQILTIANLVIMVALIIMIALQNKSTGLSSVFGGAGVTTTRRGVDKWLLYATAVAGFLFAGLSLTSVLLNR
jgi:protein translocase SecG subunit